MGKKLAIKGHPTRGKEVIELLKMMGGTNPFSNNGELLGNKENCCYYISKNAPSKYISWNYIGPDEINEYEIFTLEEFLEKYPFKVGDKVHIYVQNDDIDGRYDIEVAEITSMRWNPARCKIAYKMKNINREFYKECCDVLSISPYYNLRYHTYEKGFDCFIQNDDKRCPLEDKLNTLGKLLICRDAYWKIYGEEIGLDGPWKANFTQGSGIKYIILFANGEVIWNHPECEGVTGSRVLAFPTAEIRDAFYENFKDLIEQCKELL